MHDGRERALEEYLTYIVWLVLPVAAIIGIYRLLARLTAKRATRHGIKLDQEEVKKDRIFWDE